MRQNIYGTIYCLFQNILKNSPHWKVFLKLRGTFFFLIQKSKIFFKKVRESAQPFLFPKCESIQKAFCVITSNEDF